MIEEEKDVIRQQIKEECLMKKHSRKYEYDQMERMRNSDAYRRFKAPVYGVNKK